MEALVYNGPRNVGIKKVPDARIERSTDVLVQITTTNICGSDLHMYEGRTDMESGRILGHENLGKVIEIGDAVDRVKVGDWVCLPFNIACGFCKNCQRGLTGFCLTTNPGSAGAAYGFADIGPYSVGQAEYLRVPYGDFNCLVLPSDAEEKQSQTVEPLECLHYSLNLPTSVVITGIDKQQVLDQAFTAAKTFNLLDEGQIAALVAKTRMVAVTGQYELFKTTSHFDTTAKHPDWLGGDSPAVQSLAPQGAG